MRPLWPLALFALTAACSSPRSVQTDTQLRREYNEMVGVEWHDSVRIVMHDVVIMPVDSPHIKIKIARINVDKQSEVKSVEAIAEAEQSETHHYEAPVAPAFSWRWAIALTLFLTFLLILRLKS